MSTTFLHLVFVYGTLKSGHVRHAALVGQQFVGEARTLPRYRMVNLGSFPTIVDGGRTAIRGELWAVDVDCLTRLDLIEAVASDRYRRTRVELDPPHEHLSAEAYFYTADVSTLPDHGNEW